MLFRSVGDWVMVNGKNIKTRRPTKKFDHKMRGKFRVKRLIGPYSYELEIPQGVGNIHPVYHISMLEPYYLNEIPGRRSPTPPPELDMEDEVWEVESVLTSRTRRRKVEYLVQWKGYGPDEMTWEPYTNLMDGATESVRDFHIKNPGYPKDPEVII